jgi:hypothetical protein
MLPERSDERPQSTVIAKLLNTHYNKGEPPVCALDALIEAQQKENLNIEPKEQDQLKSE